MALARHCPKRHDGICLLTGEHDFRCPNTDQSVVPRDAHGRVLPGHSAHAGGPLRTLKQLRKKIREQGIDIAVFNHLLVLAGIRNNSAGVIDVPPAVQAKVTLRIAELIWGRKVDVEHTGLVTHDVAVTVARGPDPRVEALSVEEKRALFDLMRKMQAKAIAPAPGGEAVDAEFEEPEKEENDG